MVTREEKQRLIQAYAGEPMVVTAVIAKCSICFALLAGIVALGVTAPSMEAVPQAHDAGGQVAAAASDAS